MRVFVLAAQAPFPPRDGGTERSAAIFSVFATNVNVKVYWPTEQPFDSLGKVSNGIEQFAISINPLSILFLRLFRKIMGTGSWGSSFAINSLVLLRLRKQMADQILNDDILILDQPWMIKALPKKTKNIIVLNCHNAEKEMIQATSIRKKILRRFIGKIESTALKRANIMLYCTEKDFTLLEIESYKGTGIFLPNGVFQHKREAQPRKNKSFIFVGSAHEPNVTAAKVLVDVAKRMPDIEINIVGDVCSEITGAGSNVKLLGRVSDPDLENLLSSCSAFLNPVTEGSGMHLKIARAIANGIPIITTEFGARGFNLQNKKSAIFAEADEFGTAIKLFLSMGSKNIDLAKEASKNQRGKLFWEDLVDTNRILGTSYAKEKRAIQKSLKGSFDLDYSIFNNRRVINFLFRLATKVSRHFKDL